MGKGSRKEEHEGGSMSSESSKPLPKLVLKVGKEKETNSDSHASSHEDVHHKKKKKKHKHKSNDPDKKAKKRELSQEANSEEVHQHPPKKKSKEVAKVPKAPQFSPFQLCLENLLKNLRRKDVYSIFSFPVTDAIAPGYSKIIKNPMDFLTMQKKIAMNDYNTLDEFRDDFELMCNNAMIYNGSDTIYYKSAEKMLALGLKLLSKGKIKKMSKALGLDYIDVETFDNIDAKDELEMTVKHDQKSEKKKKLSKSKISKETEEDILSSVLSAAENVRKQILQEKPKQMYGFVTKDEEGKFKYNLLNRSEAKQKLESYSSKIISLPSMKEDNRKKRVAAIQQLWYGPYGSFGPTQDISLSKMTKDESDLLLKTYGTELGVSYAKSISTFAENSVYATDYVDRLLDIITDGAHKKEIKSKDSDNTDTEGKDVDFSIEVDMKSLESLGDIGIDVSFLNDFSKNKENSVNL